MVIDPIAATTSQSASAGASLTANFDLFLTLLTTQLQNQDPLEPMDSQAFTEQLVQFSSVEQAISTNQNLETLIALTRAGGIGDAVGYLGREADVATPFARLSAGEAAWRYELPRGATSVTLTVSDALGRVVASQSGATEAGLHEFVWDGTDRNGNRLAEGTYRLAVTALDAEGAAIPAGVSISGPVTAVDLSGSETILTVAGIDVPLGAISALRVPAED